MSRRVSNTVWLKTALNLHENFCCSSLSSSSCEHGELQAINSECLQEPHQWDVCARKLWWAFWSTHEVNVPILSQFSVVSQKRHWVLYKKINIFCMLIVLRSKQIKFLSDVAQPFYRMCTDLLMIWLWNVCKCVLLAGRLLSAAEMPRMWGCVHYVVITHEEVRLPSVSSWVYQIHNRSSEGCSGHQWPERTPALFTSSNDLHHWAGRLRVWGPPAGRLHGPSCRLPGRSSSHLLVFLLLLLPRWAGKRAQGPSGRGVPPRPLLRPLRPAAGLPLLPRQPAATAAAVAQGPLRGGREAEGPSPGSGGQVSREEEVPSALHHLGWRGDQLLLQGSERKSSQ